jgi:hypothetical protein
MRQEYILKDLERIGAKKIIQKNSTLKFTYSDITFMAKFDHDSGYKLELTYKAFGNKIALHIAGHNQLFTGNDVYIVLDKLKPIISPVFFKLIDDLYLKDLDSNFDIDFHYNEYLFLNNYSSFYTFKQSFYKEYPKNISLSSSGESLSLTDSILMITIDGKDKIFYKISGSIYTTYYKSLFKSLDIGEINFEHCSNIFEVFKYVETLKELKHMVKI